MADSLLSQLADEILEGIEALAEPSTRPAAAAGTEVPALTPKAGHEPSVGFWLETRFGFELGFPDGRERKPRNLPRHVIEWFGSLDDPLSLPRWLFYHELLGDRMPPQWKLTDPVTKLSVAPSFGLPADHAKRTKALAGIACERCGRSLAWADGDGRERCLVCRPSFFSDERSTFAHYVKWAGHPAGCDFW